MLPCAQEGGDLPEAFAVLGFAFYVQPMLMPLLHELPPGPASVDLTATAVRIVVIGVASLVCAAPPCLCRGLPLQINAWPEEHCPSHEAPGALPPPCSLAEVAAHDDSPTPWLL